MLFVPHDVLNVFLTDREVTVIKAIHSVFPKAHHMLCTFYISKIVKQHCKLSFKSGTIWEKIIQSWSNVTWVTSEADFYEGWEEFKIL